VRGAIKEAKLSASDVILVDTAGRLHIDDDLMNELSVLKKELQPSEMLFIADAMIGQDAVRSAVNSQAAGPDRRDPDEVGRRCARRRGPFDQQGFRSAGEVVGLGEKYDALEGFYPERIVSRVTGHGRYSLADRARRISLRQESGDGAGAQAPEGEFTLEDSATKLRQIRKMGPLDQLMDMLPKVGPLQNLPKDASVDEKKLKQVEAIINSMTNEERRDHKSHRRKTAQAHRQKAAAPPCRKSIRSSSNTCRCGR